MYTKTETCRKTEVKRQKKQNISIKRERTGAVVNDEGGNIIVSHFVEFFFLYLKK